MKFRRKQSSPKRFLFLTLLLLLIAGSVGGYVLFFEGEKPLIDLEGTNPFIGQNSVIMYQITDAKSGIRHIRISGTQGAVEKEIYSKTIPRTTYKGSVGPREIHNSIDFNAKKAGFSDGKLTLTVEAQDFSLRGWFQGNRTVVNKEVIIDTMPPKIQVLHTEKYLSQGGTGIAIYRISDQQAEHGVELAGVFHRGYLLGDGRTDTYISYFALPYHAHSIDNLNIKAVDLAGNSAVVPFTTVFKQGVQRKDTINIGDGFLDRKIPEFEQYYPEMQGQNIEKYLYANQEVRKQNNAKIKNLCKNSTDKRLWEGSFNRMAGSSRAGFADHRTYYYNKKPIDQQVHLGMDIASTKRAEVRAANNGIVKYADYLGIYGNMVLIDHGQGVFSLYSHLSQINVSPGDSVDKKSALGLTGTTGMAGGDHLHFSMLIHGTFVTPKEWWDLHWIEVTIEAPIRESKF